MGAEETILLVSLSEKLGGGGGGGFNPPPDPLTPDSAVAGDILSSLCFITNSKVQFLRVNHDSNSHFIIWRFFLRIKLQYNNTIKIILLLPMTITE